MLVELWDARAGAAYRNHGKQDKARGRSLEGGDGRVYSRIDGRGSEDDTRTEESHKLRRVSRCILVTRAKRPTYGNMVVVLRAGCDYDDDHEDVAQAPNEGKPSVVGKAAIWEGTVAGRRYYGADKGDEPGKLCPVSWSAVSTRRGWTDNGNGDGCESKWVAHDAAKREGRAAAVVAVSVFHFAK